MGYNTCNPKTTLVTVLTGTQEATTSPPTTPGVELFPAVSTTGYGAGKFVLSDNQKTLSYEIYFKNLTSPVINFDDNVGFAHFHHEASGAIGLLVKPIEFCLSADMKSGVAKGKWSARDTTYPFTKELLTALLNGDIYVDIHTTAHIKGELRGQIQKLYNH